MLSIVASEPDEHDALKLDLDALVREGARRMLLAALKAEVDQYVAEHADHRDAAGHALVVRNGVAEPRTVTTAAGELKIQAPHVHDRREGHRFTSAILPPWARRSPKVTEVLPVLCPQTLSLGQSQTPPAACSWVDLQARRHPPLPPHYGWTH